MNNLAKGKPVSANTWEEVKKGGDAAIEKWIASQLDGALVQWC